MSVESPPRPVPRKRNIAAKSSSSSVTRPPSISVSAKDLEVKGLRSKLDELSMQELRNSLEDAGALHGLISSLSVPQVCCKHQCRVYYIAKVHEIFNNEFKCAVLATTMG